METQSDHRRSMLLLRILTTAVRLNCHTWGLWYSYWWARKQYCHFYLYMCTTETLTIRHCISVSVCSLSSDTSTVQPSHHSPLYFDWCSQGVSVWAQHLHRARHHHCGNTSSEYKIFLLYNFKVQKGVLRSDLMIMWWANRVQTRHCPIMILRNDISQHPFLSTHSNYSISSQPLAFASTVSTVNTHFKKLYFNWLHAGKNTSGNKEPIQRIHPLELFTLHLLNGQIKLAMIQC